MIIGDFNAFEFSDGFVDVVGQITGAPDPAGALLAALSVELVAPTLDALGEPAGEHGDPHSDFFALLGGCVAGGLLYFLLDQLVNMGGGFLRRTATSVTYLRKLRRRGRRWSFTLEQHNAHLIARVRPALAGQLPQAFEKCSIQRRLSARGARRFQDHGGDVIALDDPPRRRQTPPADY